MVPFFTQGNVSAVIPFKFDEYFGRVRLNVSPESFACIPDKLSTARNHT